jgi:hypothetical protein
VTRKPGGSPGYTAKGVLPKSETARLAGLFPTPATAVRVVAAVTSLTELPVTRG